MSKNFHLLPLLFLTLAALACTLGGLLPSPQGQTESGEPITAPQITFEVPQLPTVEFTLPSPATPAIDSIALPSPTALAATQAASPAAECQNTFYPVVPGAQWEYQISGTSSGTFTRSIVSVREDGFDDQDVFSAGVTRQGSWTCQQGNLISLTPASTASVTASDVQANFTVESNTGITFPADPQTGLEWTQTMVYLGQQKMGDINLDSRNEMRLSCKAIGLEKVSVAAGDFEALRVDCTTQLSISISGMPAFDTTVSGSAWYAPGVGWVKSRDAGEMGVTEVVLLSYTIP